MKLIWNLCAVLALSMVFAGGYIATKNHFAYVAELEEIAYCDAIGENWVNGICTDSMMDELKMVSI